ncbi:MAG: PEP-CTERM sorting domain-containing protein [Okeania sp. SIO3I5]|uniref:PEP-CTERM sorting domain-containing protein n=1 Tax=Okeania sp. SIO3I5 TaxID=2607805 RepID=UPI0013BE796D|nr:PEP-CTERM sorting domain-containing protein [Okeania sp. SIO3I5]NEQ41428.1 PEP-CTERM sorting domain-containing protein [Okeania sp. SIO3I5]
MNTKLSILLTAIAGSAISAMPAQAFSFGSDNGIMFYEDTTLEFELLQSYGGYKSDLKVYEAIDTDNDGIVDDVIAGEFLFGEVKASDDAAGPTAAPGSDPIGTAGNAVVGSPAYFTFEAGKTYTLALENYGYWQNKDTENPFYPTVYSTTALNPDGSQRAVFGSTGGSELSGFDAFNYTEGNPFGNYLTISFDDAGNQDDKDYQDFTLQAMVIDPVSTPEPATLTGLGMVAGGMFLSRFRKKQK